MLTHKQRIADAHFDGVWSIAWCQGNLVSGSLDGTVSLWDLSSEAKSKFRSDTAGTGVTSVVCLQDGSTAIACYQDATIRFFDLYHYKEVSIIEAGMMEAYGLSLSPGEDVLVSGSLKGHINVWSMQEGHERVAVLPTNTKFIYSTNFSLDGKLGTGGSDGVVNVFDMSTQQVLYKLEAHALPCRSVTFSPEGHLLYSASDDRQVNLYDLRSGQLVQAFPHESMVFSVDASGDGGYFATGTSSGQLSVWDLSMRRRRQRIEAASEIIWSVQFEKIGTQGIGRGGDSRLACAAEDGSLQFYHFAPPASN
eukprot:gene4316-4737_t